MFTKEEELSRLYLDAKLGNDADIESLIESCDLSSMGEELLSPDNGSNPNLIEWVTQLNRVLSYIDENTELATTVTDDLYDRLIGLQEKLGGNVSIGVYQEVASVEDGTAYHQYPEIRGSLQKVHFIRKEDIPINDSRKSLENYYEQVVRAFNSVGKDLPSNTNVSCDLKYDGVSHVFECEYDRISTVLTRFKVELNLGKIVTHLYGNDYKLDIPDIFKTLPKYGVKTECYMTTDNFLKFQKDFGDDACNRRSAINSIANRSEENMDRSFLNYISVQPFQISSPTHINLPHELKTWAYVGLINNRHQYIRVDGPVTRNINFRDKNQFLGTVEGSIPVIQEYALSHSIPIDGIVITLMNRDIINVMGRQNDKNRFQVAYKMPAGIKKTTLKDINYSVGPVSGTITPVAIIEPVVINGSTITNVNLSNFDKLERLDLHIGDEVMIKYDIVPKLYKDKTCNKSRGQKLVRITKCPLCNSTLNQNQCVNPNCVSKIPGKICNYIRKLGIKGVGKKTINDLVKAGFIRGIQDLYALELYRDEITNLPSYGTISFNNILHGISTRMSVYPHEIIGSIGIPNIANRTMMQICKQISLAELLADPENIKERLMEINGIGEKKSDKIAKGIIEHMDELLFLIHRLDIKQYPIECNRYNQTVTFTNIRDKDFANFLDANGVEVSQYWTSRVWLVIIPDGVSVDDIHSDKVNKAKEQGRTIVSLSKAKEMFRYEDKFRK